MDYQTDHPELPLADPRREPERHALTELEAFRLTVAGAGEDDFRLAESVPPDADGRDRFPGFLASQIETGWVALGIPLAFARWWLADKRRPVGAAGLHDCMKYFLPGTGIDNKQKGFLMAVALRIAPDIRAAVKTKGDGSAGVLAWVRLMERVRWVPALTWSPFEVPALSGDEVLGFGRGGIGKAAVLAAVWGKVPVRRGSAQPPGSAESTAQSHDEEQKGQQE